MEKFVKSAYKKVFNMVFTPTNTWEITDRSYWQTQLLRYVLKENFSKNIEIFMKKCEIVLFLKEKLLLSVSLDSSFQSILFEKNLIF